MPSPEFLRNLERARQARAAAERSSARDHAPAAARAQLEADPFAPGRRAFDLISGSEVEILGGTSEHIIVPFAER